MVRRTPPTHRRLGDPAVLAFAFLALASGFGQFGAVSALGDVARAFGHLTHGTTVAEEAGLSGTQLGLGLAVLRLASLGGLPLAALADRLGRRRVLLGGCVVGLGCTVAAAASPSYWWFVVVFALGRPFLSAANGVAQVSVAEDTATRDRAKAVALVAAGYGIGSGLTAIVHGVGGHLLGFRGVFALSVVPLVLVLGGRRHVEETDRFAAAASARVGSPRPRQPVLASVPRPFRRRLVTVSVLAFAVSLVAGPANSFAFIYAQNVVGLSGAATALMVVVAAGFGLAGLVLGRFLADRAGRRITASLAIVGITLAAVLTYSGGRVALLAGYELGVFTGAIFAPAAGALTNELFPTAIRASVAGWNIAGSVVGAVLGLVAFGSVADIGNRFSTAAELTFPPVLLALFLFLLLPETRGRELEELWPEGVEPSGAD